MTATAPDWTGLWFQEAARMWRLGFSTARIADALKTDESEIWNRLDAIKALAK